MTRNKSIDTLKGIDGGSLSGSFGTGLKIIQTTLDRPAHPKDGDHFYNVQRNTIDIWNAAANEWEEVGDLEFYPTVAQLPVGPGMVEGRMAVVREHGQLYIYTSPTQGGAASWRLVGPSNGFDIKQWTYGQSYKEGEIVLSAFSSEFAASAKNPTGSDINLVKPGRMTGEYSYLYICVADATFKDTPDDPREPCHESQIPPGHVAYASQAQGGSSLRNKFFQPLFRPRQHYCDWWDIQANPPTAGAGNNVAFKELIYTTLLEVGDTIVISPDADRYEGTVWEYAARGVNPYRKLYDFADRKYVDDKVGALASGLSHGVAVKSISLTAPPANPTIGDSYIVAAGGTGAWLHHDLNVVIWGGSHWAMLAPSKGDAHLCEADGVTYAFNGDATHPAWVSVTAAPKNKLVDLNDVEVTTPDDGDALVFDHAKTKWIAQRLGIRHWDINRQYAPDDLVIHDDKVWICVQTKATPPLIPLPAYDAGSGDMRFSKSYSVEGTTIDSVIAGHARYGGGPALMPAWCYFFDGAGKPDYTITAPGPLHGHVLKEGDAVIDTGLVGWSGTLPASGSPWTVIDGWAIVHDVSSHIEIVQSGYLAAWRIAAGETPAHIPAAGVQPGHAGNGWELVGPTPFGNGTGDLDMNGHRIVNVATATNAGDAVTLAQLQSEIGAVITGVKHLSPVLEWTDVPPAAPATGAAYIVKAGANNAAPQGAWAAQVNAIAEWDGTKWVFTPPVNKDARLVEQGSSAGKTLGWNGHNWIVISNGAASLQSLSDVAGMSPQDRDLLSYSAAQSKWTRLTLGAAGVGFGVIRSGGALYHTSSFCSGGVPKESERIVMKLAAFCEESVNTIVLPCLVFDASNWAPSRTTVPSAGWISRNYNNGYDRAETEWYVNHNIFIKQRYSSTSAEIVTALGYQTAMTPSSYGAMVADGNTSPRGGKPFDVEVTISKLGPALTIVKWKTFACGYGDYPATVEGVMRMSLPLTSMSDLQFTIGGHAFSGNWEYHAYDTYGRDLV